MKKFAGILLVLVMGNFAQGAEDTFSETVNCEVISSQGIVSFIPPQVGSKITFDASQEEIGVNGGLFFHDSSMVPLQKPLIKNFHNKTKDSIVFFRGIQSENTYAKQTTNLMIGKHGDGNGGQEYVATIQEVNEAKHTGLIRLGQVELVCQPVP